MLYNNSLLAIIIGTTFLYTLAICDQIVRDLIILTDLEPDDRIALTIVANSAELSNRLLFVGTTLLNTQLKAAMARRQLRQTGLKHVPVYVGTGGPPGSYPNNVETAKAALRFWHEEGDGILSEEELKKLRDIDPEENDFSLNENVTRMNPIEGIWSIEIDGLDESKAPKQNDRYQEDTDAVIRLLDIFNIAIPPKYVYRISKVRETVTTNPPTLTPPRPLKVSFPISNVTPILLTEWIERKDWIREQSGFHHLNIRSMDEIGFEEAKKPFIDDGRSFCLGRQRTEYLHDFYTIPVLSQSF